MAPNQYADCRAANRPIRGSTHGPAPTPSRNRRPIPNGHSDRRSNPTTPPHRRRSSTNRNHLYRPNGRQCKAANHVRHVPEPKPPPNANADGTAHRALGLLETRSKPTHVAPEPRKKTEKARIVIIPAGLPAERTHPGLPRFLTLLSSACGIVR